MIIAPGITSVSIDVQIVDDTGLAVTGLVAATFPAVSWSLAGATAATSITLSDLAAITTAYSSGGIKERAGGYYRLDLPNAALASTGTVRLIGEASGKHLIAEPIVVGGSVQLAAAERQKELRRVYGVAGTVWVVSTAGSDSTGDGLTWDTAYLTPVKAVSVAASGDLVVLGPGTFALGNAVVARANGVSIRGFGIDVTTVTSTAIIGGGGSLGAVFQGGNNIELADLTIQTSTTVNVFSAPFGNDDSSGQTTGSTGVVLRRVKMVAWSDNFYFATGTWGITCYDCEFIASFDTTQTFSAALVNLELHNCKFLINAGVSETHACRALQHKTAGTWRMYGGTITVNNLGTGLSRGAVMNSATGTLELYGVRFNVRAAALDQYDIQNSTGTVYAYGCTGSDTGGALLTTGTVTTRGDATSVVGASTAGKQAVADALQVAPAGTAASGSTNDTLSKILRVAQSSDDA